MMQIQSLEIKIPSEIDNIVRVENFIEILEEYFKLPHDELIFENNGASVTLVFNL